MNILVTGANGYVGTHLLLYLAKQRHRVWGLVRPACDPKSLEILRDLDVTVLKNDLEGNSRLELQPGDIDVVIHLVGSLLAPAIGTFRSVHEGKTRFLTAECRRLGVKKLVYLGTLGAAFDGPSEYLRSKALGEEEVRCSGVPYMILRSPLIFGKSFGARESKVISRLKEMIRSRARIHILGTGRNLLQPIFIGDLVRCLEKAAADPALRDETVDLGGPDRLTFEQIVDAIAQSMGVQKPKLKIPWLLAFAVAYVMEHLNASLPVTCDEVRMMRVDIVCQPDAMNRLFGPPKTHLREGL